MAAAKGRRISPKKRRPTRVAHAQHEVRPCPRCASTNVVPILWGMPTPEAAEDAVRGRIHIGGCVITGENPEWHCNACGREFGRANLYDRSMLALDRKSFLATARATNWDVENHIHRVYETFRFRNGRPPRIVKRSGEERPAIQQSLMDWKADLGARDRMDWPGFLARHQRILGAVAKLPRLGMLDDPAIDLVCDTVEELERFKKTAGRKLVFGSKAAHFHFPWLVPVMSSEVEDGLRALEEIHAEDLARIVPGDGPRFMFSSPESRRLAYRNYVVLGNAVMRAIDTRKLLGKLSSAPFDLHAKVFEWWVIAFRE